MYPHRSAIPHEVWHQLFGSAQHEIGVLDYGGLFLEEDGDLISVFGRKARSGVSIRIALSDPAHLDIVKGAEANTGDAMRAKVQNALELCRLLLNEANVEIRLHRTTLYSSLFYADDRMLVNQRVYGFSASNVPTFLLRRSETSDIFNTYMESFRMIWFGSIQVR